ncbi:MAG: ABC transporter ATP-binding protein, partial [Nitrosopumilus sp.]|nr:ABC transporter ATP-binding protein [Nitrosopumilus sp.]
MIFQEPMTSLNPVHKCGAQIVESINMHYKVSKKAAKQRALKLLEEVEIKEPEKIFDSYPHQISGGQKQRVMIAMAMSCNPKLLIADEPTTALDVLIQAQIVNLLKNLKKDGMSFMLITHDLAVLSEIADKVGIMYGGQIVEFGSSQEIYKNPKHPYTKGLLESIPTLSGNVPKYIKGIPPSLLDPPTQCRFLDRCPVAVEKCKRIPPKFKTEAGYVRCWLFEPLS